VRISTPRWQREVRQTRLATAPVLVAPSRRVGLAPIREELALVRDALTPRQEELRQTRHAKAVELQIRAVVSL